jgi:hypothetical protein
LSYRSIKIHISSAIGTRNWSTSVHIQHDAWLTHVSYTTHTLWWPLIYSKLLLNINKIIYNVTTATWFNLSASHYTSILMKLQKSFCKFRK